MLTPQTALHQHSHATGSMPAAAMVQPERAVAPPAASSPDRAALVPAIRSMYGLTGDVDYIISAFYSPSASFEDPLVHVIGAKDVMGQFRALQAAFRLAGDTGIEVRSLTQGERHVVIDWRISYIFRLAPAFLDPWCALTLPCTTTLELNGAGRVLKHTDHWSVHELLGGIPVLGLVYRAAKRVTGKASSVLTNGLWDVLAGPNKQPPSPSSTIMGSLGSAEPPSDASLAPADGSPRGASSGTITSMASSGDKDKVLQPWPSR